MKFTIITIALFFAACTNNAPTAITNSNTNNGPERSDLETVAAHTTENQNPPGVKRVPIPASNGGLGIPIDTTAFDAKIAKAEKAHKAKPDDAEARAALADAYFERAFALTEAKQYASALGDYRSALKMVPDHTESKKWQDQIVGIYKMMDKPAPEPGKEPPPLPMKK